MQVAAAHARGLDLEHDIAWAGCRVGKLAQLELCLLYTSDAADERSSVDLGGRRIIKKKNKEGSW